MNVLVLGGTRFMGVHLVEHLLRAGHKVTIATRGRAKDHFGTAIERVIVERTDSASILGELGNRYFDVVYDNLAYSSNDVKCLLSSINAGRYIMASTVSVYQNFQLGIMENEFDPLRHELMWCSRGDFDYDETKRQAECALFQEFAHIPSVAVRFPYIVGVDDYTKRLLFYVRHVVQGLAINVDNSEAEISFISSAEAGQFLAWLADKSFSGTINASGNGSIALKDVLSYVEESCGKSPLLFADGEDAPYNGVPSFSLNTDRAKEIGYSFADAREWIWNLLDRLMLNID